MSDAQTTDRFRPIHVLIGDIVGNGEASAHAGTRCPAAPTADGIARTFGVSKETAGSVVSRLERKSGKAGTASLAPQPSRRCETPRRGEVQPGASSSPRRNALLDRLGDADLDLFLAHADLVFLHRNSPTAPAHLADERVLFPTSSALVVTAELPDGRTIGIGWVGRAGCTVPTVNTGVDVSIEHVVQKEGFAYAVARSDYRKLQRLSEAFRDTTLDYRVRFTSESLVIGACNHFFSAAQRIACWLLIISNEDDRPGAREISLTHEAMARYLGVQRQSVTIALQDLQREGLIRCGRGKIAILDPVALMAMSCDGYRQFCGNAPRKAAT